MLFKRSTLIFSGLALLVFIAYREWSVLTPFILGAIFAYILYPLVKIVQDKLKLGWRPTAILVYLTVVSLCFLVISVIGTRLAGELTEIARGRGNFLGSLDLPPQLQEFTVAIRSSLQALPMKIIPYFPGAFSKIASIFIFLVAGFYVLLDGKTGLDRFLSLLNPLERKEVLAILVKISTAVNNYLRGQLLLVFIMAVTSYVLLSFLGVKYALVLAMVIGLAELVPYIGPVVAGVAVTVVAMFYSGPMAGIVVGLGYVILNQLENVIVVPLIIKATTNIHPLIAMFAVLAGGNSFGILGIVLAIPALSAIKILFEFWFGKIIANEVK